MALSTDLQNDYAAFDGIETVTWKREPDGASLATVKGLRREVSYGSMVFAANAGMPPVDTIWSLFVATLGGNVPAIQDSITDSASNKWYIVTAAKATLGSRYRCQCRKQL